MTRRHMAVGAIAAAGVTLGLTAPGGAQTGDRAFFAVMTGAKEVDVSGTTGTGDANGFGSFGATLDGRRLCYGIQVANIANPVAAHIHRGGSRVAGPVVQPLKQPAKGDPGASSACVRLSTTLASRLRANPGNFYVNVHTAGLPNGAVRGQLFARSR
jgi:hypothetical protein